MKYLILVGDGMADFPLEELEGKTPLEVASTPAMDEISKRGLIGLHSPIPEGIPPGSDIGNLSLFGYNPKESFSGRAPLEAARQGIVLRPNEVAFRCNLVSLRDGVMFDFTSGHIPTEISRVIVREVGEELEKKYPVKFYPGVSYRHIAVVSGDTEGFVSSLESTECTPPHDITGKPWADYLPNGPASTLLISIMRDSQKLLPEHSLSKKRVIEGNPEPNSFWLWGQGKTPAMKSYKELFNLKGSVISAVDLVKGIGILAGLKSIDVPGATGWLDTNYKGKIDTALSELSEVDFVFVHVEAPDEASHQGRIDLKIRAIEEFDKYIVAPALEYFIKRHGEMRLLVTPDHITAIQTKTHAGGLVPFAMSGVGIDSSGVNKYCETTARQTGIMYPETHVLIKNFLTNVPFYIGKPQNL
ncbi:MAG: cofactor-independent phosphoglycerate mutase [Candidatus Hydrogenedentes bacterium]|nr:cofactor-independent phosphoglycerate mutase [Candidatus Hydrogenedentota bacterium]